MKSTCVHGSATQLFEIKMRSDLTHSIVSSDNKCVSKGPTLNHVSLIQSDCDMEDLGQAWNFELDNENSKAIFRHLGILAITNSFSFI